MDSQPVLFNSDLCIWMLSSLIQHSLSKLSFAAVSNFFYGLFTNFVPFDFITVVVLFLFHVSMIMSE